MSYEWKDGRGAMGNLTQKNWRDISSLVKWHSCAPTVRVSELLMTALLPRF